MLRALPCGRGLAPHVKDELTMTIQGQWQLYTPTPRCCLSSFPVHLIPVSSMLDMEPSRGICSPNAQLS